MIVIRRLKKKLEELIFFIDDYWLDCEDPENERRAEVSSIAEKTYA